MGNESASTKKRSFWKWILGAGFAAIVIIQCYAYWDQAHPFNDAAFDGETWRMFTGSDVPDNPRGKMADAVIAEVLPGTSREEVLSVLGDPEQARQPEFFSYRLGMWSGARMHENTLDIYFDNDGRFARAEVVTLKNNSQ